MSEEHVLIPQEVSPPKPNVAEAADKKEKSISNDKN